jgi:hypothetical protein
MGVVEAVDQVEVSGAATARAHGEPTRELGLGAGGKGRRFLVADMRPRNVLPRPDGIRDAIERVSGDTVDPADPGIYQGVNDDVGDTLRLHSGETSPRGS